ncbi:hypothetical protein N9547_00585 [bacterium]|nr:hypothetical protein [bacterium]
MLQEIATAARRHDLGFTKHDKSILWIMGAIFREFSLPARWAVALKFERRCHGAALKSGRMNGRLYWD